MPGAPPEVRKQLRLQRQVFLLLLAQHSRLFLCLLETMPSMFSPARIACKMCALSPNRCIAEVWAGLQAALVQDTSLEPFWMSQNLLVDGIGMGQDQTIVRQSAALVYQ